MGKVGGGSKSRNFDITEQQQRFAEEYISNGRIGKAAALKAGYAEKSAAQSATNLLRMPAIANYITTRVNEKSKELGLTFDYKLKKLKTVIDLAIPDTLEFIPTIKISDGISAIAESNKMQGHYSPEKHVNENYNLNMDVDLLELKKVTDDLLIKNRKEY